MDPASRREFAMAIEAHRTGRVEVAVATYAQLLKRFPDHPDLLGSLGAIRLQQGALEDALPMLARAVELKPGSAGAQFNLGLALQLSGRPNDAAGPFELVLDSAPESLEARLRLAQAQSDSGDASKAGHTLQAGLRWHAEDARLLTNLGIYHLGVGELENAEQALRKAIASDPGLTSAYARLGDVLLHTGRYPEAVEVCERALEMDPGHVPAIVTIANALFHSNRVDESLPYYQQALDLIPATPASYRELGSALQRMENTEHALAAFARAVEVAPKDLASRRAYGLALFAAGRAREAIDQFDQALEMDSGYIGAWMGLVHALEATNRIEEARSALVQAEGHGANALFVALARAKIERRDGELEAAAVRLEAGLGDPELPADGRPGFLYELGMVRDRGGDPDGAFEAFVEANQGAAKIATRDRPPGNAFIDQVRSMAEVLTPERMAGWRSLAAPDDGMRSPVFLVGFPRSGTTLLDQILDAHPSVQVLEEKPLIASLTSHLRRIPEGYPGAIVDMDNEQRETCRQLYARGLEQLGVGGVDGDICIDKMPLASAQAPMLARVFPDARFIFAVRHPADACLSCFMQHFSSNAAMNNFFSLEDAIGLYEQVMGVWMRSLDVFELDHIQVRYEDLVEDLEREARRLLEYLGVDWDPIVLDHVAHARSRRRINTPSYSQVSQPIYAHARYRWQRYAKQLEPFMGRLKPFAEALGYADPRAAGDPD